MNIEALTREVKLKNRRSIAKALTLVESDLDSDALQAVELLRLLSAENHSSARRIAISGPPGVGKSSFIEALGLYLVERGASVAVLAIDPSSPLTGGSILGDKTRMEQLSQKQEAFIRPSASRGTLGGIAKSTRDACEVFAAAGYDYILIETVGVGQSEVLAHNIVDCFVVLHLPNSGDDLQGIKKGINELADMIIVHKADGPYLAAARVAKAEFLSIASLRNQKIPILVASSREKLGFDQVLSELDRFFDSDVENQARLNARRQEQRKSWLKEDIMFLFGRGMMQNKKLYELYQEAEKKVSTTQEPVSVIATEFCNEIWQKFKS